MSSNKNDDNDKNKDLTRLEDLSEFVHTEDESIDEKFGGFNLNTTLNSELSKGIESDQSLIDLGVELNSESEIIAENEPEFTSESNENIDFSDTTFDFKDIQPEVQPEEIDFETNIDADAIIDTPFVLSDDEDTNFDSDSVTDFKSIDDNINYESSEIVENQNEISQPEPIIYHTEEKFEEVKNFAQNFSYGTIQGGGNPPFSLVIRNLKFTEDKDDILILLKDFGIVTDENAEEISNSFNLGSVLIPQISEYSAIILAHKIRRFDCDIEVGLSDEIHPSKSGEINPRGLIKKESLRQNKSESYHKSNNNISIEDIIVTTTPSLENHTIVQYLGVQTSFTIVDQDELERLRYVQQIDRSKFFNLDSIDTKEETENSIYQDFQKSFELIFTDLLDQIKVKAMKENANALLGLNYQLLTLPFEKTLLGKNCYQITCTGTMAIVSLN